MIPDPDASQVVPPPPSAAESVPVAPPARPFPPSAGGDPAALEERAERLGYADYFDPEGGA